MLSCPQPAKGDENSVVVIMQAHQNEDGTIGWHGGGGVIVSQTTVLTANHVVSANDSTIIILRTGEQVEMEVVKRDLDNDLALLQGDGLGEVKRKTIAAYSVDIPPVGTEVLGIGHPAGFKWSHNYGRVMSSELQTVTIEGVEYDSLLLVDITAHFGASGGGLFWNGILVGIGQGFKSNTRIAYYAPIKVACEKLLRCKQ